MTIPTIPSAAMADSSAEAAFILDPRLAEGAVALGDLPLSRLFLKDDARWLWLVLVPRRPDRRELIDLTPADHAILMEEVRAVSRALQAEAAPDKLNVASLGNVVAQLHVHVVARRVGDAGWPGPIWGHGVAEPYAATAREALAGRLARYLGLAP